MNKLVGRTLLVVTVASSLATLYRSRRDLGRAWLPTLSLSSCRQEDSSSSSSEQQWLEKPKRGSICKSLLGEDPYSTSASEPWRRHGEAIFQASLHPRDMRQEHAAWTRALLDLVSPALLQAGLRQTPEASDLRSILDLVEARLADEASSTASSPSRPLQVAVLGGSVTEGRGCDVVFAGKQQRNKNKIQGRQCAWPFRLQWIADFFLGPGIVQIHNLATGGTNSVQSLPVLQYGLYPVNSSLHLYGPDIIVNAYSTNDNHYSWRDDANATSDGKHYETCLDSAQQFLQVARSSGHDSCPEKKEPLVVFVDEYLGNAHGLVLGEDLRHEAVGYLARQTQTTYISSAAVAKPLVYANSNETLFSPAWYATYNKQQPPQWVKDPHFGMPGHVFVSWVVAYSVLESVVQYCQDQEENEEDLWLNNNNDLTSSTDVKRRHESLGQRNKSRSNDDMNDCLSISSTSSSSSSTAGQPSRPCPFAFLATPMGTAKTAARLQQYLAPFVTAGNGGWRAEDDIRQGGWQNKLGWVAHTPGAFATLKVSNLEQTVRKIHVHYLQSYGPAWEGSQAEFQLTTRDGNQTSAGDNHIYRTSFELQGFHNDNTSLAYTHHLDLGSHSARVGQSVELTATLVNGTNFKIIALMICSR